MTEPGAPYGPETPEILGGDLPEPRAPRVGVDLRDLHWDRRELPAAGTVVGTGLLGGAVLVSAAFSRLHDGLDASTFSVGALATLGLLGMAALAQILAPATEQRAALVSWPGATGAVAAGLMSALLINDGTAIYIGPAITLAIALAGCLLNRAPAFVLVALLGLTALYLRGFFEVLPSDGDGGSIMTTVGFGLLGYVVAATAIGWLLPRTRVLTGIVAGGLGLLGLVELFQFVAFTGVITETSSTFTDDGDSVDSVTTSVTPSNPFLDDIWTIVGCCALLVVFWLACSALSGHVGFRILALILTVLTVPAAAFATYTKHPTWWGVLIAAVGGLVLLSVALATRSPGSTEPEREEAPAAL